MSIKNQLRAAILSGGATASMPSTNAIVIPSGRYIAPTKGYVCVQANGSQLTSYVAVTLDQGVQQIIPATAVGQGLSAYTPIGKGQSVTTVAQDFSAVNCLFVKLVGGGKNPVAQLIWRVVPCLRSTFDRCLSRTVDRIRACQRQLGLYTKRQRLTLMRRSAMSLKRTVGVQSKRTVRVTQHMLSATSRWSRSRLQQVLSEVGGLACLSKRRRAIHTCIALQQATEDQRRLPWSYSRTLVRNLCLGGASHA